MASAVTKSAFSVKEIFKEAIRSTRFYWRMLSIFLLIMFVVIYAVNISLSELFQHLGQERSYLFHWVISPLVMQFIIALVILIFNGNIINLQANDEHKKFPYFTYFRNLFYIYLLTFYIGSSVLMIASQPDLDKLIMHSHHAAAYSAGISIMGMLVYFAALTLFYGAVFHVLLNNVKPLHALKQSVQWVKPHWFKVSLLVVVQFILSMVAISILHAAVKEFIMPIANWRQVLLLTVLTILSMMALLAMVFNICVYLAAYLRLSQQS